MPRRKKEKKRELELRLVLVAEPPKPPDPSTPPESSVEDFLADIKTLLDTVFLDENGNPKPLSEISWGDLSLLAMKLGMMDPLNDPENYEKLMEVNTMLLDANTVATKEAGDQIAKRNRCHAMLARGLADVHTLQLAALQYPEPYRLLLLTVADLLAKRHQTRYKVCLKMFV